MHKYLILSLMLSVSPLLSATPIHATTTKAAPEKCKDCGCNGPAKGMCPDEKGNECHCPKK
jgi:hypothetical protein